jgi:hypothetical protein
LIDETQHTDVFEKIIEKPIEEDLLYRRNITEDTKIISNQERNLMQEDINEKSTNISDQVDFVNFQRDAIDKSTTRKDVSIFNVLSWLLLLVKCSQIV